MSHDTPQPPVPFEAILPYDTHLLDLRRFKEVLDFKDIPLFGSLPELLQTLWLHLGLDVRFVRNGGTLPKAVEASFRIGISGGQSPGQLVLIPSRDIRKPKLVGEERHKFLTVLAHFVGDAYRWQHALRQYEETQAATVNVTSMQRSGESLLLLLKESAKLADFSAASLYLLDSQHKSLKLRSCWGLPEERLLDPPKPLHESLADVEAILGQIVVINEDYLLESWRVPEDFPMAVCLPVMTQQSVWGTLWLFSEQRRDCTEHELSLLEYIAGRVAAELERLTLHREVVKVRAS
ncbi:MAG: GAF domain-containing protein [Planctomycetaceae bacterium]|nr:GAF domain-containing protein [Planctomycetaceae bacterium]